LFRSYLILVFGVNYSQYLHLDVFMIFSHKNCLFKILNQSLQYPRPKKM
jgi:hypothetical protein